MNATTQKCPMCAEQIPADAAFCPYCGTRFGEGGQIVLAPAEPVLPPPVSPATLPAKKSHTGLWIAGAVILVVLCGVIGAVLWSQRLNLPAFSGLLATPTPSATPTLTPTLTPTIALTRTPRPTPTATHIPAWVTDFAEPLLAIIANRPPNFEDDFSVYRVGWGSDPGVTFRDGVMHMSATGGGANAGGDRISAADFVIEYEFIPIEIDPSGGVHLNFRGGEGNYYHLGFMLGGSWDILYSGSGGDHEVARGQTDQFGVDQKTTVLFIIKGDEMALYLNGQPIGYGRDGTQLTGDNSININAPNGTTAVDIDNVKFWDLNNLLP